jgi:hypothetical protein
METVSKVTNYRLDSSSSIFGTGAVGSFLITVDTPALGSTQPPIPWVLGGGLFSSGVKWSERETGSLRYVVPRLRLHLDLSLRPQHPFKVWGLGTVTTLLCYCSVKSSLMDLSGLRFNIFTPRRRTPFVFKVGSVPERFLKCS